MEEPSSRRELSNVRREYRRGTSFTKYFLFRLSPIIWLTKILLFAQLSGRKRTKGKRELEGDLGMITGQIQNGSLWTGYKFVFKCWIQVHYPQMQRVQKNRTSGDLVDGRERKRRTCDLMSDNNRTRLGEYVIQGVRIRYSTNAI